MDKNYIEITKEWFDGAVPNYNKFKERRYVSYKGKRFYIDGKNVKFEYRNNEKEVAGLLQEVFGGTVYTIPNIYYPKEIRTADYKYINNILRFNDYVDLKTINSYGNRIVDNRIKEAKGQANNFILYFTNSNMTYDKIMNQIKTLYRSQDRRWVNTIIVVKDGDIRVFQRAKNKQ